MRYYVVDNQGNVHAESQSRDTLELLISMFEAEHTEEEIEELGFEIIEGK